MKVLITGGAGYIGSELTRKLSYDDSVTKIVILDNLARKNYNLFISATPINSKVKVMDCELLDSRALNKIMEDIDVVYHLAAKVTTPFADQDAHFFEQTNNWGTAELTYAIENSNVKKLIFLSSTSVYGSSANPAKKDGKLNPKTFYGISKMRGEKHIKRIKDKVETYTFRCGNVYGYGSSMRFDAVINRFMLNAHFENKIDIHGNGVQSRPFIHVSNVVDVLYGVYKDAVEPGLYNLIDKNLSIMDIADTIKEIYPNIEMNFINQHLKLKNLNVEIDNDLKKYNLYDSVELKDELISIKEKFSFQPDFS